MRETETRSAASGLTVTPNDSNNLLMDGSYAIPTRGVYVGTGGNLAIQWANGTNSTFTNVASGTVLPIKAIKVLATGTTASGILALY